MPVQSREPRSEQPTSIPEVFSPQEVARAAGVATSVVRQLIGTAEIPTVDGEHITSSDAATAVEALRRGRLRAHPAGLPPGVFGSALLSRDTRGPGPRRLSVLMSTGLHASVILVLLLLATLQLTTTADDGQPEMAQLARLVFVAEPGPGGGRRRWRAAHAGTAPEGRASGPEPDQQPGAGAGETSQDRAGRET